MAQTGTGADSQSRPGRASGAAGWRGVQMKLTGAQTTPSLVKQTPYGRGRFSRRRQQCTGMATHANPEARNVAL